MGQEDDGLGWVGRLTPPASLAYFTEALRNQIAYWSRASLRDFVGQFLRSRGYFPRVRPEMSTAWALLRAAYRY